tara:strand:- start:57 stop:686 length:630 start_codon:yes stop_codon:yes gene_type:complete
MNKIKIIFSAFCLTILSTSAFSEGLKVGINAAYSMFETSGSETLKESSNITNKSIDEDLVVPSLFVEVDNGSGMAFGLDYVPVAELGSGTGDDDDAETSGANKASAELASHLTVYALKNFGPGLFVKAGLAFADVDTTETLATGDSYSNTDTTGLMIGVGKEVELGEFFARATVSHTDYDDVSITSTNGSVVKASVDSTAVTLSIGKEF